MIPLTFAIVGYLLVGFATAAAQIAHNRSYGLDDEFSASPLWVGIAWAPILVWVIADRITKRLTNAR